jgi:hypothetical protein
MFKKRLDGLGMYDEDSDYDGMIGKAIEELSHTFSEQGHSGMSAQITMGLFNQLMDEYNSPDSYMWQDELGLTQISEEYDEDK